MAAHSERRLYGHRGASARIPENTIVAFGRALVDGATAIETDVHLTADGHVVISHDETGRRRAGIDKAIATCTLAELKDWEVGRLPTGGSPPDADVGRSVGEVSERAVQRRHQAAVEKPPPKRVVSIVAEHDAFHRVTLASFHDEVLAAVARTGYPGELSLSAREAYQVVFAPRWLTRRFPPRGTAIQIPPRASLLKLDTRELVERCHSLGLRVDYWVINNPEQARRLLDLGADGIVTDDPAVIAPVMGW